MRGLTTEITWRRSSTFWKDAVFLRTVTAHCDGRIAFTSRFTDASKHRPDQPVAFTYAGAPRFLGHDTNQSAAKRLPADWAYSAQNGVAGMILKNSFRSQLLHKCYQNNVLRISKPTMMARIGLAGTRIAFRQTKPFVRASSARVARLEIFRRTHLRTPGVRESFELLGIGFPWSSGDRLTRPCLACIRPGIF